VGYGDEIMLSGIVKKAYQKHKKPVALGRFGQNYMEQVLWGEVFENNPKIDRNPGAGAIWVHEIKGNRPYIDYYKTQEANGERVVYKKSYRPEPGELFFTEEELAKYGQYKDFIYIEPNVKGSFGGNKDWGFKSWQEVVKRLPYEFIQGRGRKLDGVQQVDTSSFRYACSLLSRSSFFVGTDGGLHHAAAALGIPAVVIWGGLVGPEVLGYDQHVNLRGAGVESCGNHKQCGHCKKALELVTVEMVVEAIRGMYEKSQKESGVENDPSGVERRLAQA